MNVSPSCLVSSIALSPEVRYPLKMLRPITRRTPRESVGFLPPASCHAPPTLSNWRPHYAPVSHGQMHVRACDGRPLLYPRPRYSGGEGQGEGALSFLVP